MWPYCLDEIYPMISENDPKVRLINVGGAPMGDDGAKKLSSALINNTNVTRLFLMGEQIGSEGIIALSKMLTHNHNVESVNLSHNDIGKEGAKALGEMLKTNKGLKSLWLQHCHLTDDDIRWLLRELENNFSLEDLNLVGNKISSSIGAKAVACMLRRNQFLKTLYLAGGHAKGVGSIISKEGQIRDNVFLETFLFVDYQDPPSDCSNEASDLYFYLALNRSGRRRKLLRNKKQIPAALWPLVFAKLPNPSALYYYLGETPEILYQGI